MTVLPRFWRCQCDPTRPWRRVEAGLRFLARSGVPFSHVLFVCGVHEFKKMQWCWRWLAPGDSVIA
jgi:hypothetical protein